MVNVYVEEFLIINGRSDRLITKYWILLSQTKHAKLFIFDLTPQCQEGYPKPFSSKRALQNENNI